MEGVFRKSNFYILHKPTTLGLVISPKIKNFWLSPLILPNFLSVYMRGLQIGCSLPRKIFGGGHAILGSTLEKIFEGVRIRAKKVKISEYVF